MRDRYTAFVQCIDDVNVGFVSEAGSSRYFCFVVVSRQSAFFAYCL